MSRYGSRTQLFFIIICAAVMMLLLVQTDQKYWKTSVSRTIGVVDLEHELVVPKPQQGEVVTPSDSDTEPSEEDHTIEEEPTEPSVTPDSPDRPVEPAVEPTPSQPYAADIDWGALPTTPIPGLTIDTSTQGCTTPNAANYDKFAAHNDGSCLYIPGVLDALEGDLVLPETDDMIDPDELVFLFIAATRAGVTERALTYLLKQPGVNPKSVVVSQDGNKDNLKHIEKRFGNLVNWFHHPQSTSRNYVVRITAHYGWALDKALETKPNAKYIVLLENDVFLTPDFMHYIRRGLYYMKNERDVPCISGGAMHPSYLERDPERVYKRPYFSSIGTAIKRELWENTIKPNFDSQGNLQHSWHKQFQMALERSNSYCIMPSQARALHISSGTGYSRQKVATFTGNLAFSRGTHPANFKMVLGDNIDNWFISEMEDAIVLTSIYDIGKYENSNLLLIAENRRVMEGVRDSLVYWDDWLVLFYGGVRDIAFGTNNLFLMFKNQHLYKLLSKKRSDLKSITEFGNSESFYKKFGNSLLPAGVYSVLGAKGASCDEVCSSFSSENTLGDNKPIGTVQGHCSLPHFPFVGSSNYIRKVTGRSARYGCGSRSSNPQSLIMTCGDDHTFLHLVSPAAKGDNWGTTAALGANCAGHYKDYTRLCPCVAD